MHDSDSNDGDISSDTQIKETIDKNKENPERKNGDIGNNKNEHFNAKTHVSIDELDGDIDSREDLSNKEGKVDVSIDELDGDMREPYNIRKCTRITKSLACKLEAKARSQEISQSALIRRILKENL